MIQIFSKKEIVDIIKRVTYLKESCLLTKGVSKTIESGFIEEPKSGYTGVLIGTLGVSLLSNISSSKEVIQACKGTIRAGEEF